MKKLIALIAVVSVSMLSGCATANRGNIGYQSVNAPAGYTVSQRRVVQQTYYVDARVVDLKKAPMICDLGRKRADKSNPLAGAIIGGLIGRQFGKGRGKNWNTGLGVVAGAMLATETDPRKRAKTNKCRSDGYIASVQYIHPLNNQFVFTDIPMEKKVPMSRRQDTYISIPVSVDVYE